MQRSAHGMNPGSKHTLVRCDATSTGCNLQPARQEQREQGHSGHAQHAALFPALSSPLNTLRLLAHLPFSCCRHAGKQRRIPTHMLSTPCCWWAQAQLLGSYCIHGAPAPCQRRCHCRLSNVGDSTTCGSAARLLRRPLYMSSRRGGGEACVQVTGGEGNSQARRVDRTRTLQHRGKAKRLRPASSTRRPLKHVSQETPPALAPVVKMT